MLLDRIRAITKKFNPFFRRQLDRDLDDELSFHLAMRAQKVSNEAARRRFGNLTLIRETCREVWTVPFFETFLADAKYSARSLLRNPAFGAIAVLTLAVGIAANTAMFSVLYAVLLRPLSYPNPEQLVALFEKRPKEGVMQNSVAPADFLDWREQARSFSGMAAMDERTFTYVAGDEPERVRALAVSPGFFEILGIWPAIGRDFARDQEQPGSHMVAVVTHQFWKRHLGGDPQAVGRKLVLTDQAYTLIGILPERFMYPIPEIKLFIPFMVGNSERTNRFGHSLSVVGRLKPAVSYAQAQKELDVISASLDGAKFGHFANLVPLHESLVGDTGRSIVFMSCAAGVLLLIACINAANLFLGRSIARTREWMIRSAIGASKSRLVRQMLAEGIVVSCCAGAMGVAIAAGALQVLKTPLAEALQLTVVADIGLNTAVLVFAMLASLMSAVIFSMAPAFRILAASKSLAVRVTAAASVPGRALKRSLVVTEVALATLLAGGTALLVRSFVQLSNTNPGFRAENVVSALIPLPSTRYREPDQVRRFSADLKAAVRSMPGVIAAGFTSHLPMSGQNGRLGFVIEGVPPTPDVPRRAHFRIASSGYFEAMGISLRRGRLFTESDTPETQAVMIINETAARQHFGARDPIGMRARFNISKNWYVIAGVVGDVKHWGLEREPQPEAYLCAGQEPTWTINVVARTGGEPEAALAGMRAQVRSLDRAQVVINPSTLDMLIDKSMSYRRLYTSLVGLFAFTALLLAGVGAYGVIAYLVSSRTSELGVRLALGATPANIMRSVVGEALLLSILGIACGSAALFAARPLVAGLLFGVAPNDGISIASANLLLIAIAVAAAWGPARRAARLDPSTALRVE
jgi:predicted permease